MSSFRDGVSLHLKPADKQDPIEVWYEGLSDEAKKFISPNDRALLRAMLDAEITDQRLKFQAALDGMPAMEGDQFLIRSIVEEYASGNAFIDVAKQEQAKDVLQRWGW